MDYEKQIENLQQQIEKMQEEIQRLDKEKRKAAVNDFNFTDEQVAGAALDLMRVKLEPDDWDIDLLDDFKEKYWSKQQLNRYAELNNDDMNEILRKYLVVVRDRIDDIMAWVIKE